VSPRVKPKRTADDVLFAASDRVVRGELAEARLERLLLQANRGHSELAEFRSRVVSGERTHAASPDEVWWKYLLAPAVPSALGGSVYGLDREEHRVLSKASSAAGGYLVPTGMDDQITAARRARAVIGAVSREVITSDGTTMLFPSTTAHGVATWTAENASYTASDETFGQVSIGAFKGSTKVIVSEELARDAAADLEGYLADELGQRIAVLEETAFAVGDGSGKPLGIVHASSPYTVSQAAVGSSLLFKPADILQFYKALPVAYRLNAVWIIAADDFASLAASADASGVLAFPGLQFDPPSLYGRPVLISADLPTPAASAKSLAFGDWQVAYTVRRVQGVAVQRLEELHSDNGQIGFRAFERLDGRPLLSAAAIIGQHSAT
jgi:HK97 family phage major capsid protein